MNMSKFLILKVLIFFCSVSYGQTTWESKIKTASKQGSRIQQIEALKNLYELIPIDSLKIKGDICYSLSFRYRYVNLENKADSLLKYTKHGIESYRQAGYVGYKRSRLTEYKGFALNELGNKKEAFETYDSFDNLEMVDYRAVGSYLMAKVDQAIIFRQNGDNEAGIQLLEYAENQPFFNLSKNADRFRFYFEKSISYGIEDSEIYNSKSESALNLAEKYSNYSWEKLKLNQQRGKLYINEKQYPLAIKEI